MLNRMFQKHCQELRVNFLPLEMLTSSWKRMLLWKSSWDLLSLCRGVQRHSTAAGASFAPGCCPLQGENLWLERGHVVPCPCQPRGSVGSWAGWMRKMPNSPDPWGSAALVHALCSASPPARWAGKVEWHGEEWGSKAGVPFSVWLYRELYACNMFYLLLAVLVWKAA